MHVWLPRDDQLPPHAVSPILIGASHFLITRLLPRVPMETHPHEGIDAALAKYEG
jgi:hypothetical protein